MGYVEVGPIPTSEQLRTIARLRRSYKVVKTHYEAHFTPHRYFVWMDDGVSMSGIDNTTHEVQVHPDGTMIGDLPGED